MLLAALAGGSDQAFELLYKRYWEKVHAVAFLYLKDNSMAEDIVQETFLRIWQKRAGLPAIHNFQAFLHVVARNLIITTFRKKTPLYHFGTAPEESEKLEDQNPKPALRLEQRETSNLIDQAITRLPYREKQTYLLSSETDLSLKEVARELNISYESARQYKSKALQFIRSFLAHNSCILYPLTLLLRWL